MLARAPSRHRIRLPGPTLRVGDTSAGRRRATGIAAPSGPARRPSRGMVCSSCHRIFSRTDRLLPEPETTRLIQEKVRRGAATSGRWRAEIVPRSQPPGVTVSPDTSNCDVPKRLQRSVRWTAQINSHAPANGNVNATQATVFPFWIAGTAPRKVAGVEIRFHRIAMTHATRRPDWDRIVMTVNVSCAGRAGKLRGAGCTPVIRGGASLRRTKPPTHARGQRIEHGG